MSNHVTLPCAQLCDYHSGEPIRIASYEEARRSRRAAATDGGRGVFTLDGRSVYVEDRTAIPRGEDYFWRKVPFVSPRTGANWQGSAYWEVCRDGSRWLLTVRVAGHFSRVLHHSRHKTAREAWAAAAARPVTIEELDSAF